MTLSEHLVYIIPMAICLLLSAYFSATETAFSTFNRTRLKTLSEKNKRAKLVIELSEKYDKLLSTVLIGNNIVNISLSSLGTLYFTKLLNGNSDTGATVSTIVVTLIVLTFGEITPKNVAKDFPETFAMFSAPIIKLIILIFRPVTFVFSKWKLLISKMFKRKDDEKMSQEELLMLVDEVQQDGSIDKNESELLRSAIEFSDQRAEDILTPRTKLIGFPHDTDKAEIAQLFTESQFSRLLVYEDSIDNIIGVLHQKDFFTSNGISDKSLSELIKVPVFIHQTEKINDLLRILQKEKTHLAIVIDEYGGTLGIVTMEDILEELVGDIWDEHDDEIETFKKISENVIKVDASCAIDDFGKYFKLDIESESISVNGWIMEQLNKIPDVGDNFIFENLKITVTETDPEAHRTLYIEVEKLEASDIGEDDKNTEGQQNQVKA